MAQTSDPILELNQDTPTLSAPALCTPTLDALAPSTHPPLVLPEGIFAAGMTVPPVLGFAPAPIVPAPIVPAPIVPAPIVPAAPVPADFSLPAAVPADLPPPLTRPKGRFRTNWYEALVVALILTCAALCLYRLLWAIQI